MKIIKKFMLFFTALNLVLGGQAVCFAENGGIFQSYDFYTATVYLVNDETNSVIFRNVKKYNLNGTGENALELEYSDLPVIKDNIFSAKGERLSFDTVNTYMLDQKVVFMAARNPERIKIIYMEFTE